MSDQDQDAKVTLYPPYVQAVESANKWFSYGDVVPLDWLWEHFQIERPGPDERLSMKEYGALHFRFMAAFIPFNEQMVVRHQKVLTNIRGEGYLIVHPAQQTDLAMERMRRQIAKEIDKASRILTHIRHDMLSTEQARHNVECQAKVAALRSFSRDRLAPPGKTKAITKK